MPSSEPLAALLCWKSACTTCASPFFHLDDVWAIFGSRHGKFMANLWMIYDDLWEFFGYFLINPPIPSPVFHPMTKNMVPDIVLNHQHSQDSPYFIQHISKYFNLLPKFPQQMV